MPVCFFVRGGEGEGGDVHLIYSSCCSDIQKIPEVFEHSEHHGPVRVRYHI